MKKIIVNVTLIVSAIVMLVMFGFFMYDFVGLYQNDSVISPYFERFLSFWLINLIGAVLCIVSLILINKGEGEVFKMSMKEGLAKWREKKAEKKLQKDNTQKQARIAELEQELNELKKDE